MNNLIAADFNGISVSFRNDAYLNATAIASHFGKRTGNYLKTEQTQEYINALTRRLSVAPKGVTKENQLVIVKQGGKSYEQGTWLHPKLAIHFARWLSAEFAVWCDEQIEIILSGNKTTQSSPDERAGLRAAVTMLTTKRGLMHNEAYHLVHQYFNVGHIEEIPREQLPEAVEYVQRMALVGEVLPPTDEQRRRLVFAITLMTRGAKAYLQRTRATEELWLRIAKMKETAGKLEEELEAARQSMQALSRDGAIWDGLHEAQLFLDLPTDIMKEGHEKAQDWR